MTKDKLDQLPEDARQLVTAFHHASPVQRQAMLELAERWAKGIGPFGEEEGLASSYRRAAIHDNAHVSIDPAREISL